MYIAFYSFLPSNTSWMLSVYLSIILLFIYLFISKENERDEKMKKNHTITRMKANKLILIYKHFCNTCFNRFKSFHSNELNYLKWNWAHPSFCDEIKSLDEQSFTLFDQTKNCLKNASAHTWIRSNTEYTSAMEMKCQCLYVFFSSSSSYYCPVDM